MSSGLGNIALDEGTVLGIGAAVYLLAPRLDRAGVATESPQDT